MTWRSPSSAKRRARRLRDPRELVGAQQGAPAGPASAGGRVAADVADVAGAVEEEVAGGSGQWSSPRRVSPVGGRGRRTARTGPGPQSGSVRPPRPSVKRPCGAVTLGQYPARDRAAYGCGHRTDRQHSDHMGRRVDPPAGCRAAAEPRTCPPRRSVLNSPGPRATGTDDGRRPLMPSTRARRQRRGSPSKRALGARDRRPHRPAGGKHGEQLVEPAERPRERGPQLDRLVDPGARAARLERDHARPRSSEPAGADVDLADRAAGARRSPTASRPGSPSIRVRSR